MYSFMKTRTPTSPANLQRRFYYLLNFDGPRMARRAL
jgi:hypothetical protein